MNERDILSIRSTDVCTLLYLHVYWGCAGVYVSEICSFCKECRVSNVCVCMYILSLPLLFLLLCMFPSLNVRIFLNSLPLTLFSSLFPSQSTFLTPYHHIDATSIAPAPLTNIHIDRILSDVPAAHEREFGSREEYQSEFGIFKGKLLTLIKLIAAIEVREREALLMLTRERESENWREISTS